MSGPDSMVETSETPCPDCSRPMARVAGPDGIGWTCFHCNAAGDPEFDHLEDPEPCSCDEALGLRARIAELEGALKLVGDKAVSAALLDESSALRKQIGAAEGLIAAVMRAMWVSEGLTPQLEDPFHSTVLRIRDALTRVPLQTPIQKVAHIVSSWRAADPTGKSAMLLSLEEALGLPAQVTPHTETAPSGAGVLEAARTAAGSAPGGEEALYAQQVADVVRRSGEDLQELRSELLAVQADRLREAHGFGHRESWLQRDLANALRGREEFQGMWQVECERTLRALEHQKTADTRVQELESKLDYATAFAARCEKAEARVVDLEKDLAEANERIEQQTCCKACLRG